MTTLLCAGCRRKFPNAEAFEEHLDWCEDFCIYTDSKGTPPTENVD